MRATIFALLLGVTAVPALAASDAVPSVAAATDFSQAAHPAILSPAERDVYKAIFSAIRGGRWSDATTAIDAAGDGVLSDYARAELYLAKGSPRVERDPLIALLTRSPDLPQAAQLLALAKKRGATDLPVVVAERDFSRRNLTTRSGPPSAQDAAAATLAAQVKPLLKADQPAAAEALLQTALPTLAAEAQTEWQERLAWSYYLLGDDASALRLATLARAGIGEWTTQAAWVAGLASWRKNDFTAASDAFSSVASHAGDNDMRAAGQFWAARADMAAGHPERVQTRLRTAAKLPETFYGLIAAKMLGKATPAAATPITMTATEWSSLSANRNVRVAAALAEVGELALADQTLRHQAKIATDNDHLPLLHLAATLDLPATQIWLARNAPAGMQLDVQTRYPSPGWTPQGGWRVDKALVYAHALQESLFRTDAQSLAGARGLLQVLPSTADLIEKKRGGQPLADKTALYDPAVNMDYGQTYLEQLRDAAGTGGLLPKVIAAYNAGPGNVVKWNLLGQNQNDPLLYIESIPYFETRAYVAAVLRNYWLYQQEQGAQAPTLKAMAQDEWPRFPSRSAATAMREPTPIPGVN